MTRLQHFLKALRIHHWSKNLLIVLPCLAGLHIRSLEDIIILLTGITLFGLCASGTYLINDLLDRKNDVLHHKKKHRPIAAGHIKAKTALTTALILVLGSLAGALAISLPFFVTLLAYLAITLGYSFYFKRIIYLDILILSSLYLIRIVAGLTLSSAYPTTWLFAFTGTFFLSLAALKRFTEVQDRKEEKKVKLHGRGYSTDDGGFLQTIGILSGILAVTTLTLYIFSSTVRTSYQNPWLLLTLSLSLTLWLDRAWRLAKRKLMHSDPVVFAIKEPLTYLLAAVCLTALWLAL